MKWLRLKIRKWLGIAYLGGKVAEVEVANASLYRLYEDLTHIGVDVHFKEPHMILIYSRLNGGQLREIPAHFDSLHELNKFTKHLKERYNTRAVTHDTPPHLKNFF